MHKSALLCLIIVMTFGLLASTAGAVNVNGTKFYDYDQNGIDDNGDFPLENWNITLYWLNGTAVAAGNSITGVDGNYNISGIDPYFNYTVCEDVKPGWTNTTPSCYPVSFVLCGNGDPEFFTNESNMIDFMDNEPDMNSRALLLYNARIGDPGTGNGQEELKIGYPLGQWNPGQSSVGLSPNGDINWTNNTYVPFNATWVPGVTLYENASWTVDNVTVDQDDTHDRTDAVPIRDIVIRLHSEDPDYYVEVNNLSIHQGPYTYNLINSYIPFNGSTDANNQDLYFVFRASNALTAQEGQDIGSGGFSFTGDIRFTWPEGDTPSMNDIKMDIIVGRYDCDFLESRTNDFGNFIEGNISGYKLDDNENGLEDWNITLTNTTSGILQNFTLTGFDGNYSFLHVPFGTYYLNETPQIGWIQLFGNYTITIDPTNTTLTDLNFTNMQEKFCIDGYKIDNCTGEGLEGWNITVKDESEAEVGNSTTDENGHYKICDLIPGNYSVCEEVQPGWMNLTPSCVGVEVSEANVSDVNFTNTLLFCIEGYKLDETGLGLQDWNITVKDDLDQEVGTATTDETGFYQICGLIPGDYTVCEELQPGWVNVSPICQEVTLPCENLTVNFTNMQETFCIDGYKIDNCTGDGLEGWNITVKDESVAEAGNATTDENGHYQICDLVPGNYTVCEELQTGWKNLTLSCVGVEVAEANVSDINFTNTQLFCIEGYKIDETGLGLQGWNITVKDESGEVNETVMTGQDGFYLVCNLIPGDYTVCEELQPGWTNITPTCQEVTLRCDNLIVNFTNTEQEFCIQGYKIDNCTNLGIENWNITVKDESGDVNQTVMTGEEGFYQVCGLLPGSYTVCEEVQPGWVNLTPSCVDVDVTSVNVSDVNFTNTQRFCIEGYKIDETGLGLQDWNITVKDESGNVNQTATTDENGFYQVCDLIPGDYTVCEELQLGWVNVTPSCQNVTLPCNNLTVNFTNMQQEGETFCIDGYKIDNCTGDGLEGWNIMVKDEFEAEVGNATTDENGHYQVCDLFPGDYTVCEELQPGWMNLTSLCVDVEVTEANVSDVNFTNTRLFCIEGYKIDETGLGLQDWNITVKDESGDVNQTVMTDEDGFYQVCDLIPGDYTVCEELQPGWTSISPICQNVTLGCEDLMVNFTNTRNTFCIDGYKIDNCSGEGLDGWTIYVRNESEVVVGSSTTDPDGFYQVCDLTPGNYTVCEIIQPGWKNLTPLCADVEIIDADVNDINFTNTRQFCIEGYKLDETGLGLQGWNITVKDELDDVNQTVMTDEDGFYQICGLIPGDYTVCEEMQQGWINLTPSCVDVTLPCENLTVNFTNMQQQGETFCIDGYKIDNCNGEGLEGWNITVRDASEAEVGAAKTDENGFYRVCSLIPGNYTVCEELQNGWMNLTPLCMDVQIVDADVNDVNFTNTQQFCIEGHKILAENGLGQPGWNISVIEESGQEVGIATTDENGFYQVCGLIPGNYTVCEELQPGFVNLTPLCQNVTLSCENLTVDFINDPAVCINGYKIDNCTGLGVPDWIISVRDESDALVGSATTDQNGFYQVCGLIAGNYTVCEELQPGWMNLTPLCVDVVLVDTNVNNLNFTNTQQFCINGYKIDEQTGLGLPGWNISVLDEYGENLGTAITDQNGFYQVCGLIPGNYTICEEMQQGWINLTPSCVDVTLPCNDITVNFTNMQTFGQICGWVGANCNFGEISPPDVRVRFALNASDLTVPGKYFETTTDIRGVYCISGLPTGQPLFGIALSPLAFPDRYLERPISYQVDSGKLITCEDSACTPQIPPLANNGTLQVNWVLTNNQAFFNPMPL
jgi:uncharacterized surface anchored protein